MFKKNWLLSLLFFQAAIASETVQQSQDVINHFNQHEQFLFDAIKSKNFDLVETLLFKSKLHNSDLSSLISKALRQAINVERDLNVVQIIVNNRFYAKNLHLFEALCFAVINRDIEMVNLLIKAGAKVQEPLYPNSDPITIAFANNDHQMIDLLIGHGAHLSNMKFINYLIQIWSIFKDAQLKQEQVALNIQQADLQMEADHIVGLIKSLIRRSSLLFLSQCARNQKLTAIPELASFLESEAKSGKKAFGYIAGGAAVMTLAATAFLIKASNPAAWKVTALECLQVVCAPITVLGFRNCYLYRTIEKQI